MSATHSIASNNLLRFPAGSRLPRWKRTLDILGSVAVLPLLIPLVMLMAIVTRFKAPGPVLFRQERVGMNGRRFTMLKFRTMKAGASSDAHRAHALDFIRNNRPMLKMDDAGDSRLIPFGRILRATGLDELPQVFNVLRGEMSLVGPRPCVPYEYEAYLPAQRERFRAMPGLTGLWQVSGKNRLSFEQMVHLDIQYAQRLSLLRDLRIMLKTPVAIAGQVMDAVRARRAGTSAPVAAGPAIEPVAAARNDALTRHARRQINIFRYPEIPSNADRLVRDGNA